MPVGHFHLTIDEFRDPGFYPSRTRTFRRDEATDRRSEDGKSPRRNASVAPGRLPVARLRLYPPYGGNEIQDRGLVRSKRRQRPCVRDATSSSRWQRATG